MQYYHAYIRYGGKPLVCSEYVQYKNIIELLKFISMKNKIKNIIIKVFNMFSNKQFVIICSTGGSGSSFVANIFSNNKWLVCLRPDGGSQKSTHSEYEIYLDRTRYFFKTKLSNTASQYEMFSETYEKLSSRRFGKIMLLSMAWSGHGFMGNLNKKVIYLVRDPVYTFNSYSGGGWRKEGGERRINYVGASGPNDKVWIDSWLDDFSLWAKSTENALKSANNGKGYLVRYHSFKEDWSKIPNMPPVYLSFGSLDAPSKYEKFLTEETVEYIRSKTNYIWNKVLDF